MNCTEVATILDTHRITRLSAAERAAVDEHLTTCENCDAAWHAQAELAALRVPPVPATLLERALLAARVPEPARPRRAWAPFAFGAALLGGAALAGMTIASLTRSPSAEVPSTAAGEPSAISSEAVDAGSAPAGDSSAAAQDDRPTEVELVETGRLDVIPLVRENPAYPPQALAKGIGGHVQLKFDVTAAGAVENVSVVESSDAVFEESAVAALSQWRYLPRILGGKRVRHNDVRTIIRFQLAGDKGAPPPDPRQEEAQQQALREYREYGEGLEVALDRLAVDDFRGVELQLDEMQAVFGAERADLWNFYGYLYTLQGNYARAIDAYEQAVAVSLRAPFPSSGPIVPLARLYFARHQYDMSLKTLLRPRQATNGTLPLGGSRLVSEDASALIEQLRALGVTEETLVGR
jgi:TonB family protein